MLLQEGPALSPSSGGTAPPAAGGKHETLFSTSDFIAAWSRSFGENQPPLAIPVKGSGPPRTMYAFQVLDRYGIRSVLLAPHGLYASPGWEHRLERSTLKGILHALRGFRTRKFTWTVRFDHEPLATGLASLGLKYHRESIHQVLPLDPNYDR